MTAEIEWSEDDLVPRDDRRYQKPAIVHTAHYYDENEKDWAIAYCLTILRLA